MYTSKTKYKVFSNQYFYYLQNLDEFIEKIPRYRSFN